MSAEHPSMHAALTGAGTDLTTAMLRTAAALADRCVVSDIEISCDRQCSSEDGGQIWYDLRPMLSEDEHSPQALDMNAQALAWAFARSLVVRHPNHQHLVRIAPHAQLPSYPQQPQPRA